MLFLMVVLAPRIVTDIVTRTVRKKKDNKIKCILIFLYNEVLTNNNEVIYVYISISSFEALHLKMCLHTRTSKVQF